MKLAASLARVSTAEQATKTSLTTQLAQNVAYAERAALTIAHEFSDDVSGTVPIRERPNAGQVYSLVERRAIQAVIISTFDRTTRDEKVLEYLLFKSYLNDNGVELHYSDTGQDTYTLENNLVGYIKSYAAAQERKRIIDRTSRGRRARAAKGLNPARVPFIYNIIRDNEGNSIGVELDPQYQPMLDEMARMFIGGMSFVDMAVSLGRHPVTGLQWSYMSVMKTMQNPFLLGRIVYRSMHGTVMVEGRHAPAWDDKTCEAVAAELARRKYVGKRVSPHRVAPFSGVLFCDYCGTPMSIVNSRVLASGQRVYKYGCAERYAYRKGQRPAHGPNYIADKHALAGVREWFATITEESISERMAALTVDNPDNSRWVTEQLQAVNEQLAEIESDLGAVRSPTARAALGADIKRLKIQHAELTRKLQAEPVVNFDVSQEALAHIMALAERPELVTLETAPVLLRGMVFRVRDKRVGW